jgi:hypothetical protein
MGIDISNSLLVGASYDELEEWIENKIGESYAEFCAQDVIEEYFESASPYYDSPTEEHFLGFKVPNYHEVNGDWWVIVEETAHQFELLTGVKARIRGGAHVW